MKYTAPEEANVAEIYYRYMRKQDTIVKHIHEISHAYFLYSDWAYLKPGRSN